MSNPVAHVMIQYIGNSAVVECLDSKLSDELTIQGWRDEISSAIEKFLTQERVILSFRNVRFMSSSALRALISLKQKAEQKKIALFLCNISENNLEVFKITKLDSIFRITPSEREAQRAVL